ncbi:hypothetical protein niasHT_021202 [Heterodera trifolii]|uniref:EGF-like domain-containing protein n=1 Tax=Heterodera trifolii TaxID=157864 RepID=A0ABD2KTA9_9BILA
MSRQKATIYVIMTLFIFLCILLTSALGQLASPCSKVSNLYSCKCIVGHRDMDPENPGRKCVSMLGFNECAREEDNECSENAKCIDMEFEYKCQCLAGYKDASPKGTVPGSKCVPL